MTDGVEHFDFFKVNGYPTSGEITEIWENREGVFVNATEELGLDIPLDQYRGLTIGDFDNDGDTDVFVQKNSNEGLDILLEVLERDGRVSEERNVQHRDHQVS